MVSPTSLGNIRLTPKIFTGTNALAFLSSISDEAGQFYNNNIL
jgi:hypothetical protein